MKRLKRPFCAGLAAAAMAVPGVAQQPPVARPDLPADAALAAIQFHNSPMTLRFTGETWIARGAQVNGDVAVLGGPLHLDGEITGSVLVVNGDLRVGATGSAEGGVTVIGGALTGLGVANLRGPVLLYQEPLRYTRQEAGLIELAQLRREPELAAGLDIGVSRAELTLRIRDTYNRVEGLPIAVGPRFRTGSTNPTELQALLIYRTAPGLHLDLDEVGWHVIAEQAIGGLRRAGFGVTYFSEIVPIETGGLSDREASLATFIFHRDYRDHYERKGWSVFGRVGHRYRPGQLVVEFRDERHSRVAAAAPWSLFRNDEPWRPQPVIAEGRLRSAALEVRHDSRNDIVAPSSGWHAQWRLERGLGGSLRYPVEPSGEPIIVFPAATPADQRFTYMLLDLRRYARIGPEARLAIRVFGGGALHSGTLPPQRQLALGGEGSLPGYRLFRYDCDARAGGAQEVGDEVFYPAYGCDRAALVQLEYHAAFPFARRLLAPISAHYYIGDAFGWVLFFDAGRAWTDADERFGRTRGQNDFSADAGLGIRLGDIGLYAVLPLSGSARGTSVFIRLGPRF